MLIEDKTFDEERALYGRSGLTVKRCRFDGPADGESAFKECADINVSDSFFNLRYPFWHDRGVKIVRSEMTELCRAALWYTENVKITDTDMHGIKALRECKNAEIENCDIVSSEFGWSSVNVKMRGTKAVSEYFFMRGENLDFADVDFKGKYSFQYIKNSTFKNCRFDTKDAFWHSENVTVENCVVKGEYLAWYSQNLTLINCKIIGTQPLCYCNGLKLVNCEMEATDLSFEKSEVVADITTPVISVKNPRAGVITLPAVGEIIMDDPLANGRVIVKE